MSQRAPLPSLRRAAASPFARWGGVLAGCGALVALALVFAWRIHPPTPPVLTFELSLPAAEPGQREPILCTGMWGEGDLLLVEYLDATTVVFHYDHWGHAGLTSPRIAFHPGQRRTLRVEMPALTTYQKPPPGARAPLRLVLDGRDILHAEVPYHGRQSSQLFFGENPIGASAARFFRGTLFRPGGSAVRGGANAYFTTGERLRAWVSAHPWQLAAVSAMSVLLGSIAWGALAWILSHPRVTRPRREGALLAPTGPFQLRRLLAVHPWFAGTAVIATLGFAWIVTLGGFQLLYPEVFGSFYDYQARSFLQGRLDVPEDAIEGEAFEAKGKLYGYFGPTPALLRLPLVAFDLGFARLSRVFMLLYFGASLLAAYLLLRDATRLVRGGDPAAAAEPSAFSVVALVASVGLGSTVFFLGSRALIFHEAILAGIAFALWSAWCALRYLQSPASRWWLGALACGVLSLHARPPTGLFALTLLGCVAATLLIRDWNEESAVAGRWLVLPPGWRRHFAIGLLCVAGQLSLNGLAYLKFGTFDPAPLRISRPYTDPGRLDHIEGRSFHTANLPYNFHTYVVYRNARLDPGFPWIYFGGRSPPRECPHARIDLPDTTLALPYAMPSLFGLASLGCFAAFLVAPRARWPLGLLWSALLPMTLALFAAVATAQRYTGDFVPFLTAGAAFGLAAIDHASSRWRLALRPFVALLTAAAIAVTLAATVHYQGVGLWGVPEDVRQNYQTLRKRVDAFFGVTSP